MKKHAVGIIFFALIVSFFAAGYTVIRLYPMPDVKAVEHPVLEDKETWFCETPFDTARIQIVQAIADPAEKTILLDLSIDKFAKSKDDGPVGVEAVFSFYIVEGDGARLVRSEEASIVPAIGDDRTANGILRYKSTWAGELKKSDNLYVIARVLNSERQPGQPSPFSKELAMPVLIARK